MANFVYYLYLAGPYGDLRSAIISKDYQFTLNIKFSLTGDIADGMYFLQQKGIMHGNLRSCAIYIEADLSAKVGDWYVIYQVKHLKVFWALKCATS